MKSQTKVQHQPNDVMKIKNSFVHESSINRYEIDCKMWIKKQTNKQKLTNKRNKYNHDSKWSHLYLDLINVLMELITTTF